MIERGPADHSYYWLTCAALVGVVISIYYYFGVIRAIYWSDDSAADRTEVPVSRPTLISIYVCIVGMLYIGIFPGALVNWTKNVAANTQPAKEVPAVTSR